MNMNMEKEDIIAIVTIVAILALAQSCLLIFKLGGADICWSFALLPAMVSAACILLIVLWRYVRLLIAVIKYYVRKGKRN